MKISGLIILLSGLVAPLVMAQTNPLALGQKYARHVGQLALADSLYEGMSSRCNGDYHFSTQLRSRIDYTLRQKTGYTFERWQSEFNDRELASGMVSDVLDNTLVDIGGCKESAMNRWHKGMQQNVVEPAINSMEELPIFWGFKPSAGSLTPEQLTAYFYRQVSVYQQLSVAELEGLASALETGFYHFSIHVFGHQVSVDKPKAVKIRAFIYAMAATPKHLFDWANSLKDLDREEAIKLFKQAAEAGSFYAQRWYGNYLGCIGDSANALVWLNKAKQSNPDDAEFIDDFIAEIKELGEPTNCIDGWVY